MTVAPRVWYVLACGWPEPAHYLLGTRYWIPEVADLARSTRQAEELPAAEGGATWHVVRIEPVTIC